MRRECREYVFPSHRSLTIPTCITARAWRTSRSLTSGFLWSRWRGKRSWHSRRMRNPPFTYLLRPMEHTHGVCFHKSVAGNSVHSDTVCDTLTDRNFVNYDLRHINIFHAIIYLNYVNCEPQAHKRFGKLTPTFVIKTRDSRGAFKSSDIINAQSSPTWIVLKEWYGRYALLQYRRKQISFWAIFTCK